MYIYMHVCICTYIHMYIDICGYKGFQKGSSKVPLEDPYRAMRCLAILLAQVMVFFSACNSVKFHDELLNYVDVPVQCIHGQKKQVLTKSSGTVQLCIQYWVHTQMHMHMSIDIHRYNDASLSLL